MNTPTPPTPPTPEHTPTPEHIPTQEPDQSLSNTNNTPTCILGIESSCDETAVSIVKDGQEVVCNIVASQHELHQKFGGVVPEIASRAHIERILPVYQQALDAAGLKPHELDAIAVGNRPGLIGSLLVGVSAAKALAWSLGLPLIGVDHVKAHLYAAALEDKAIAYPALGLVVSGGHSSLYQINSPTDMSCIGSTIDDAVGEAFDKVAAILEIGFPGGPIVDKLAKSGDEKAIKFPRTLLDKESLDFSFSGLKTAVLYEVRGIPKGKRGNMTFDRHPDELSEQEKADVCASFQAAVMDVIEKKIMRAYAHMEAQGKAPQSLIIGGGVSANSKLRERVLGMGDDLEAVVRIPKMAYCLDNAAMIAGLGHHLYVNEQFADLSLSAVSTTEIT